MSVLIKGMNMPTRCECCRFSGFGGLRNERVVCMFTGENAYMNTVQYLDDCPLVPIPPHGRLIDADAFSEEMKKRHKAASDWYDSVEDNEMLARAESTMMAFTECRLTLDAMQTVIEAEDGE